MRRSRAALIIVSAALLVRVLHLVFTATRNPLASDIVLDAEVYRGWALALIDGYDPGPTRLMQAPLYPWFITAIFRVAGDRIAAVRLVQALLGTASVAMIMTVTLRLFRSNGAALVAGTAAALYAPLIFYEGVLVPAALIVFLDLLFLVALIPPRGSPGTLRLLFAGALLGICAMAKPVALLLLPFAAIHLFLTAGTDAAKPDNNAGSPAGAHGEGAPTGKRSPGIAVKSVAALAAGLVFGIAPLTIRNAMIAGEFIPLTTGGGINFYIGNGPSANGFYALPRFGGRPIGGTPEEQRRDMYTLASTAAGRDLSPAEVSRFWLEEGLEHVRAHPPAAAALAWRKFLYFWNRYERANVESIYFHGRFPGPLRLPLPGFGLIAPFGLLGIFLTSGRWRRLWPLYGGLLAYLAAALIFYVLARYRLPVVLFLLPFTGAACVELVTLARARRMAETALAAAALALLLFFSNMTVAHDSAAGRAGNLTRLGAVHIGRGERSEAAAVLREALEIDPGNTEAEKLLRRLKSVNSK